jgi:hypothetical protein
VSAEDVFEWWDDAVDVARARAWASGQRQQVSAGPEGRWVVTTLEAAFLAS